jgi:thiol-disulfide isomerase/thioredoxin
MDYAAKFEAGLSYLEFLERYGNSDQKARWAGVHAKVKLSDSQTELLKSFTREMKVLVVAGAWCGDCVNQCPIFDHFAKANDKIRIRYFDRDVDSDLSTDLLTCGGQRVPTVLFLSEDNYVCGRYGDRTLSKYRQMSSTLTGAACATGFGDTLLETVTGEWLNEFERIQWMLRTSGRLREKHGD